MKRLKMQKWAKNHKVYFSITAFLFYISTICIEFKEDERVQKLLNKPKPKRPILNPEIALGGATNKKKNEEEDMGKLKLI